MYLILLGIIAVGAGLLLVYYSVKDKKSKSKPKVSDEKPDEKGKVIYLFDEDKDAFESDEGKTEDPKPHSTNLSPDEKKIETEKTENTDKDE